MQSIFGALLTAGYAAAAGAAIAASGKNVNDQVQTELTKSFSSAADTATRYPASVQDQIVAGAKTAFLQGDQWAYTAGHRRRAARRRARLLQVPEARRRAAAARRLPPGGHRMSKQFKGTINVDDRDSVPDWEPYLQPVAPPGAPERPLHRARRRRLLGDGAVGRADRDAEHQQARRAAASRTRTGTRPRSARRPARRC